MKTIDLRRLNDAAGRPLPESHPVRRLVAELPWLHGLPSVRMFFRLILSLYRARLQQALQDGLETPPDAAAIGRELFYLENTARRVVCDSGRVHDTGDLYRKAVRDIRITAGSVPWLREKSLRRFDEAVAALMRGVRLQGPRYVRT